MKYLSNHPRTSNRWKPDRIQIDAWFFFDDRGSSIQKSLEGLLHAILHRVASSDKRLAEIILPVYAEKHSSRHDTWPISDLRQALMLLLNQEELGLDIHLFLDALDEYGDPPEVIADFVADMSDRPTSCTKIKICFSSRPWNVFLDRFGHCPGFAIHEHTESDIRRFARSLFVQNGLMTSSQTSSRNEDAVNLLSEIVRRAKGVFLWAKLVSTDLIKAYHEGASFAELHPLVLGFPEELEDYYTRIVDRLPQSRRFEAFAMLEVVARYEGTLNANDFTEALRCALSETFSVWPTFEAEKTIRHVRDYTGGLLEVVVTSRDPIVQFMHQTVKHLVSKPGFTRRLLGSEASELRENGHSFLAKYYIAKTIATNGIGDHDIALLGMLHARLSETTTGVSQRIFFDSLEDESVARGFQRFMVVNSRMSLAVVSDLRLYVRERLEKHNTVNENPSLSLLYCLTSCTAMRSIRGMPFSNTSVYRLPETGEVAWGTLNDVDLTEMCQILLGFGASLRTRCASLTPFEALFAPRLHLTAEGYPSSLQSRAVTRVLLRHGQDTDDPLHFSKHPRSPLKGCRALHLADAEMSKLLLEHGANVNALDNHGCTPLDIALYPNLMAFDLDSNHEKVCHRISILLDYGACITENRIYLTECMNWLRGYDATEDVVARLRKVSRLTLPLERQSASPEPNAWRKKARLSDQYTNSDSHPQTPPAGRTHWSTRHTRPSHPALHTRPPHPAPRTRPPHPASHTRS